MGRRTLLLIASILVAATGTGVVALYARNAQQVGEAGSKTITVWVAVKPITAGTTVADALKNKLVRTEDQAVGIAPDGAIKDLAPLTEQKALVDIAARQVLTPALFSQSGSNSVTNPVGLGTDKKLVALSVLVADVDRVAGFVQPGNYVALIALTDADDPKKAASHILFPKPVKVLKIAPFGSTAATPEQTLVTLELKQDQANTVVLAAAQAKITMAYVADPATDLDMNPVRVSAILPTDPSSNSGGNP